MPAPQTPPMYSVAITAGGTPEILIPAADVDTPRKAIIIQPQTEACLINFGQTAGARATGTLRFTANPADAVTIVVNGVTLTFLDTVTDPTDEIQRGASATLTRDAMLDLLQASVTAGLAVAEYEATTVSSDPGILITFLAGGTDGNAYTLADSSGAGAVTRSAATLAGGSDTVGNGLSLALGQIAVLSAADFPQIQLDVYVVSASDGAVVAYTYGQA